MIRSVIIKKQSKLAIHKVLTLTLVFSALTCVFFAGYYSSDRTIESIASYACKVVDKNTINKKFCTITAQATSDSGSIPDSYGEFHSLYGIFKQQKITFASALNLYNKETGDKDHNIRIDEQNEESNFVSNNLSLLYFGPVGTVEYNGHYKHYTYPIELMFEDSKERYSRGEKKYIIYISQSHANKLLELYGELPDESGKFSKEQYQSLIDNPSRYTVNVKFEDTKYKFAIMNIYYHTNYYYEGVSEALGEFAIVSYYLPNNLRSEQKNIYYLSEYSYQNKYFMQYINNVYSNGKYKIEVNHQNIIGDIDDKLLTSFYYGSLKNSNIGAITILLVTSSALLLGALFIVWKKRLYNSLLFICSFVFAGLIPYIVFRLLYKITYSSSFFTFFSCKVYLIMLIIAFALLLLLRIISHSKLIHHRTNKEDIYEVHI